MLWAFIPGKVLEEVGGLPYAARRLDTGQWVTEVEKWASSCGWFDLDSPSVEADYVVAKRSLGIILTPDELSALRSQVSSVVGQRNAKRAYVLAKSDLWAPLGPGGARTTLSTWLTTTPPGTTAERLQFLYDHLRFVTQVIMDGFDLTITMAHSQLELIEQSPTFQIPPVILE